MATAKHVYLLKGKVQHYTWGGYEFIPQLLSINNIEKKPFAEYWMGAHPNFSSLLIKDHQEISLHELFVKDQQLLGDRVAEQFGSLPFLFKVLDVRQMLSIQVHPSKTAAETGFKEENEKGIPLTAPHRNYKDNNHKPELMVALSDFWLLHGFKPAEELKTTLAAVPEFSFLIHEFKHAGYKGFYEHVMTMPQKKVDEILAPVLERIMPSYQDGTLSKSSEGFWAARAAETFCGNGHYDRGIFSVYFFNLLHLKKGEGVYQPEQMPHAYLEGQNIEIMANSDNVLRAGLTDKHIDIGELLKHVKFDATVPSILGSSAEVTGEVTFKPPAKEFGLYQYKLSKELVELKSESAEILLVLSGAAFILAGEECLELRKGQSALVVANTAYSIKTGESVELFRAVVGDKT